MNQSFEESKNRGIMVSRNGYISLGIISIGSLLLTFIISISSLGFAPKIAIFVTIIAAYCVVIVSVARSSEGGEQGYLESKTGSQIHDDVFTEEIDEKLSILDEAGKFFSASLKSDDMFRLVASRIDEIVSHKACVLFLPNDENKLDAAHASGNNSRAFSRISIECDQGIAGKALISEEIERDDDLSTDARYIDKNLLAVYSSSIAVPLKRGVETFGVLVFYRGEGKFSEDESVLLESACERVAPLLLSSFAFEQNISNSMTDALTNLPNERAFYLVLENQIAEAQRFQKERPLTILTIDIKEFADFNRLYGHSNGDSLLAFASKIINGHLRQMDFLCRSMNDEFWVILPTASDEVTEKIVERIEKAFTEKPFEVSPDRDYFAELNFGMATYLRDGESTNQLLQTAILRKKQLKADEENTVIMFPKEYVN